MTRPRLLRAGFEGEPLPGIPFISSAKCFGPEIAFAVLKGYTGIAYGLFLE